jgi:hypothetical protein
LTSFPRTSAHAKDWSAFRIAVIRSVPASGAPWFPGFRMGSSTVPNLDESSLSLSRIYGVGLGTGESEREKRAARQGVAADRLPRRSTDLLWHHGATSRAFRLAAKSAAAEPLVRWAA